MKPTYYKKDFPKNQGFSCLAKKTKTDIIFITIFDDGATNVYFNSVADIMAVSELAYYSKITQKEFVDQVIMLKKIL